MRRRDAMDELPVLSGAGLPLFPRDDGPRFPMRLVRRVEHRDGSLDAAYERG